VAPLGEEKRWEFLVAQNELKITWWVDLSTRINVVKLVFENLHRSAP